jgi:hypothetical protein
MAASLLAQPDPGIRAIQNVALLTGWPPAHKEALVYLRPVRNRRDFTLFESTFIVSAI